VAALLAFSAVNENPCTDWLTGPFSAYPGDRELLDRLGLKTYGYPFSELMKLGQVVFDNEAKVDVFVLALPAQSWNFVITRPDEESFKLSTGTGKFTEFWPMAAMLATNCVSVSRL
jgi:hypothetical protein